MAVSMGSSSARPPLPTVPEPPIFDASYYLQLLTVLNDSSFPSTMPAEEIYDTRLKVIQAIIAGRKQSSQSLSINLIVTWGAMVLLCTFLLVRIRCNRQRALRGDANAARNIVLAAFEPLLWLLGGANLTFIAGYGTLLVVRDFVVNHSRFTMELVVDIKLMNALLVPIYMLQPSLSARALRRAICLTLLLSMYTVPVVVLLSAVATPTNQRVCYWVLMASRSLVGLYLLYLVASPPARASAWSFRFLCIYVVSLVLMMYWMAEVYHRGHTNTTNVVGWLITAHSTLLPLCVWHVLRADTEHWRGIGKRAVELQEIFRRKHGKIDERVSSQGLHVLIEMHRKYIIDFARLQVREPISEVTKDGRTSTVYRGYLHTKKMPVAIKVYMPTDFTEETVAEFSHEAALCGALVHPNILKFHGLCVCPPNICLVTELCQASLQDIQGARQRLGCNVSPRRQQLLIDLGYMIDATRAIAYLHSFSPAFVHCDIKPSSFLVDDNGTVKLTDFGASRTPTVRSLSGNTQQYATGRTVLEVIATSNNMVAALHMAPEVVRGHHAGTHIYGEAADIYSLAMTMWDIFHPGKGRHALGSRNARTSTTGRDDPDPRDSDIFELVIAGHRPPIDPLVPSELRNLIQVAWHTDPRMRPSAQALLACLEVIQEELSAPFALEFMNQMNDDGARGRTAITVHQQLSFPGASLVQRLYTSKYVFRSEAIRLGNMLMDCGFLHHTKHVRAFADSGFHYVFDAEHVLACQPLALLAPANVSEDPSHDDEIAFGRIGNIQPRRSSAGSSLDVYLSGCPRGGSHNSSHAVMNNRCACRKLGQRMETPLTTQRRFRLNFRAFTAENLLTAKLLADDEQRLSAGYFAAFGEPSNNCTDRTTKGKIDVGSEAVEARGV